MIVTPQLLQMNYDCDSVTPRLLQMHYDSYTRVVTNAAEIERGGLMVPSRLGLLTRVTTGNLPHFIYPLRPSPSNTTQRYCLI